MTIREGIGDLVDSMTGLQKLVLGGVAAVVLMVMVSGWVSSYVRPNARPQRHSRRPPR